MQGHPRAHGPIHHPVGVDNDGPSWAQSCGGRERREDTPIDQCRPPALPLKIPIFLNHS